MSIKDFLKTTKGKVVTLASGATVVAAGIVIAVLLQGSGYRSIVVEQTEGTVSIAGTKNSGVAYQGEKLFDGDAVSVQDASSLVMCMDLDKYVYADAGTNFSVNASSPKEDSKLKITLTEGSELNDLKSKLGPNDSYEVDTPNSTMSVRGTRFRVTVYYEGNLVYTLLEVETGEVLVRLKTSDGTYNGVEKSFTAGQSALIRGNSDFSEFVVGEENEIVLTLNYEILPKDAVPRLIELIRHIKEKVIVGDVEAQHLDSSEESDGMEENLTGSEENGSTESADNLEEIGEDDTDTASAGTSSSDNSSTASNTKTDSKNHVHTPGDWVTVTKATCQADGQRQKACSECGAVVTSEKLSATGHVASDWVINTYPDCSHTGAKTKTCISCGKIMASEDIPTTAHSYSNYVCTICGATDPDMPVETETVIVPCSHNWVLDPFSGFQVCTICGETKHL